MAIEKRERFCWEVIAPDGAVLQHSVTHADAQEFWAALNGEGEGGQRSGGPWVEQCETECFRISCDEPAGCDAELCCSFPQLPLGPRLDGGWRESAGGAIFCPTHPGVLIKVPPEDFGR